MIQYEIIMSAYCDGCGKQMNYALMVMPSEINKRRWDWIRLWKKRGCMSASEYPSSKSKIYCQGCSDGKPSSPRKIAGDHHLKHSGPSTVHGDYLLSEKTAKRLIG